LISSNDPSTDTEEFRSALADNLTRESLTAKMSHYYYGTKDSVWSSWSDSDLHNWLVSHGVIKSDSQIQRDKLVKMVQDNYGNAQDTVWAAWTDSQMRDWLIEHGYLRTDAQKTRDELIKLMNQKVCGALFIHSVRVTDLFFSTTILQQKPHATWFGQMRVFALTFATAV
jgi:hypothetical protein